jgi:UDP-N-acetylmuramate--alanine ligase
VWAVFQPHLYSRTARFHDEFGAALSGADEIVVTDVYGSREEPVPGVTGAMVAEAVERHGGLAHYVPHRRDLADFLAARVGAGDLVLTMGAGDITLVPTELAVLLAERR